MKVNLLLWGAPGIGKTAGVLSFARRRNLHVEVVLASIREPADFGGLPLIKDGRVDYAPPGWAVRLVERGGGLLFLDEISTAPPAVQAALLRVVLDRVVGDLVLPERLAIVSAANPPEMTSGGWDLSPPLANRFCHLDIGFDTEGWLEGFPKRFSGGTRELPPWNIPGIDYFIGLSPVESRHEDYSRNIVVGFHKSASGRLHQMPSEETKRGRAWPSPRTWEMAAHAVASTLQAGGKIEDSLLLVSGCVGEAAALEFITWVRQANLPDPEALLLGQAQLPDLNGRGDVAWVVAHALAQTCLRLYQPGNKAGNQQLFNRLWDLFEIFEKSGFRDVAARAGSTIALDSFKAGLDLPKSCLRIMGGLLNPADLVRK